MQEISEKLLEFLLIGNKIKADKIFNGIFQKENPFILLEKTLIEVMDKVGDLWELQEISLAQYYLVGVICEELFKKYTEKTNVLGKIQKRQKLNLAIVTLEDYHGLGRKIVLSFLNSAGFEIKDYGLGKTVNEVFERSLRDKIDILLVSTLMLPAALKVKELVKKLKEKKPEIKIVVGGAPFRIDENLWKEVEADEFGETASEAVKIVRRMVEHEKSNI
ncbi:MAG: cobalamin-dependent protein [Thermosipho sp. (in: Bacteria)]|nr:cobalamin-dependent protein [Thermosipho sp. (in: thermotogales)]